MKLKGEIYSIFFAGCPHIDYSQLLSRFIWIWSGNVSMQKIYHKANRPLNIDNILYELSIFRDVTKHANSASAVTASLGVVSPSPPQFAITTTFTRNMQHRLVGSGWRCSFRVDFPLLTLGNRRYTTLPAIRTGWLLTWVAFGVALVRLHIYQ